MSNRNISPAVAGWCTALAIFTLPLAARAAEPVARSKASEAPLSADETRAFMRRLADCAVTHHLKRGDSPQRGMMYEYVWWQKRGQPGQFIQGEALDTMHDGAWFASALVNAHRATGEAHYKEVLVDWQLPFYLKMLNHGAELFSSDRVDVIDKNRDLWRDSKEWLLQGRENGFVPYWWDNGGSISLEMLNGKLERPFCPCTNDLAGQLNPECRLSGYSHGCSNHMAQDLGIMLQQAWLMLRRGESAAERGLAEQCAQAARNLQDCRTRHGSPGIPAVVAACGVANGDTALTKRLPAWDTDPPLKNHFTQAMRDYQPGQKCNAPGFADDSMYRYYAGIARYGTPPRPLVLKLMFDAFSEPLLWQIYRDDGPVPPGMNKFDLYPLQFVDGRPAHLASEGKGPHKRPIPSGSRMGPQNMAVCGWVLQALRKGDADAEMLARVKREVEQALGRECPHADVRAWLERELGAGLRTWQEIFERYGYVPTGIGCQSVLPSVAFDEFSDTGGYAHLITAAAMWLMYLDGRCDWELMELPRM